MQGAGGRIRPRLRGADGSCLGLRLSHWRYVPQDQQSKQGSVGVAPGSVGTGVSVGSGDGSVGVFVALGTFVEVGVNVGPPGVMDGVGVLDGLGVFVLVGVGVGPVGVGDGVGVGVGAGTLSISKNIVSQAGEPGYSNFSQT